MPSRGPYDDDGVLAFLGHRVRCQFPVLYVAGHVFHVLSMLYAEERRKFIQTCMRLHAYRLYITIVRYGYIKRVHGRATRGCPFDPEPPTTTDSSRCATV